jgi:hypothetical protein
MVRLNQGASLRVTCPTSSDFEATQKREYLLHGVTDRLFNNPLEWPQQVEDRRLWVATQDRV